MQVSLRLRERSRVRQTEVIVREFPIGARIKVRVGDIVTPETIVAEYESSRGFRVFHLANLLGVSGKHINRYLKRKIGSRIYTGEIIAERPGVFGIGKKIFKAPIDGTIQSVSPKGDITVSMVPAHVTQAALYWGKVVKVSPDPDLLKQQSVSGHPDTPDLTMLAEPPCVSIETQTLTIYGIMGSGRKREGQLNIVCEPEDFFLPQHLEQTAENSVIVCGALIEHGVLEKAIKFKVAGIVAGGIHLRDATAMGIKMRQGKKIGTDVGVSLLVTEGFGPVAINQDHYQQLVAYKGRYVVIDGNLGILSIPLKPEEVTQVSVYQESPEEQKITAQVGMIVRSVDTADFGKTGRIVALPEKATKLPSGLDAIVVKVALNGTNEVVMVPAENLEATI